MTTSPGGTALAIDTARRAFPKNPDVSTMDTPVSTTRTSGEIAASISMEWASFGQTSDTWCPRWVRRLEYSTTTLAPPDNHKEDKMNVMRIISFVPGDQLSFEWLTPVSYTHLTLPTN